MKRILLTLSIVTTTVSLFAQNKIDRPGFYVEYPKAWGVDKNAPGYDPDGLFTITADQNNNMMFMILDGKVDPAMILDVQQEEYRKKVLPNPTANAQLTNWGSFKGQ